MSSEQYSRWSNKKWKWNMVEVTRLEGETMPRFSWRRIYKCLFPETTEFPDPCCPTDVERMSPQPLSLLPGPRDNSEFETYRRDWFQQQTNCPDSVVPIPSSESTSQFEPQLQSNNTKNAVNLSPGQRPGNTSLGAEPTLLPGQTSRTEAALQFLRSQRPLSEYSYSDFLPISDTTGTRRSGNANQVDRLDSPIQRPRAPSIGLHGLESFKITSSTHIPAISPRILPEPLLPPLVQNKSELNYVFEFNTFKKRNHLDLISDFQGFASNPSPATSTEEQFPRYLETIGPDGLRSDSRYGGLPTATVGIPPLVGGDIDCSGETQSINGHISDVHLRQGLGKGPWRGYVPTHSQMGTERTMSSSCHVTFKNKSELTKHQLQHSKPFVCDFLGCTREVGFSTKNDLARHQKAVHEIHVPGYGYSCDIDKLGGWTTSGHICESSQLYHQSE
ncbi:hypothetical protein BKA56DRAFT_650585 [Ilyonectria sp. MPI-CAGE-AT-0026]|nr:hypothetical protein BKA56DRAFT_650585 [Ilyonectria sp. MPI-CAGE-AT-0026]